MSKLSTLNDCIVALDNASELIFRARGAFKPASFEWEYLRNREKTIDEIKEYIKQNFMKPIEAENFYRYKKMDSGWQKGGESHGSKST